MAAKMEIGNHPGLVDDYFGSHFLQDIPGLSAAQSLSQESGLVPHAVSPLQGAFLHILAKATSALRVLEIGTLGGYSTIWLASAVSSRGGSVTTIEIDEKCYRVAETAIANAGLAQSVQQHLGDAQVVLKQLIDRREDPFDLIFIDADKPSNPAYLDLCLSLSREGTVIIGDNVVRDGKVVDAHSKDPKVNGIRAFTDKIGGNSNLTATAVQTVGSKGYDGFVMVLVEALK